MLTCVQRILFSVGWPSMAISPPANGSMRRGSIDHDRTLIFGGNARTPLKL